MSSILKVDTIQDQAGNNIINESGNVITIGASGDTITVPAGATVSGFTSAGIDDNATSTAITISSGEDVTFTENILLGDSKKALFGAGSDLQIYHDGSNSYVDDTGTGRLILRGNDRVQIQKYTGEDMVTAIADGAVNIYHNNAKKFETTATGATVTGNITATGNLTTLGIDDNATSVAITIDSSERIGIGNTSPTGALDVKSGTQPQLKVATASPTASYNSGFLVTASNSATAGSRSVVLSLDADGGDGSGTDNLTITKTGNGGNATITNQNNASLVFGTNNAEAARFTTNTFMVGKTSASGATNGVELKTNDESRFTQTGRTVIAINRLSSDGSIVDFKKDNTSIGTIASGASNTLIIGTDTCGVRFYDISNVVQPRNTNGSSSDNTISLGMVNNRFKDVVLGGGVFLGGTGTANKLDDYEEGTFTPTFAAGITNVGYNNRVGNYIKVGGIVYFDLNIQTNAGTGSSARLKIGGLPFQPPASIAGGAVIAYVDDSFVNSATVNLPTMFFEPAGGGQIEFYNTSGGQYLGTDLHDPDGINVYIGGTYRTG